MARLLAVLAVILLFGVLIAFMFYWVGYALGELDKQSLACEAYQYYRELCRSAFEGARAIFVSLVFFMVLLLAISALAVIIEALV